MNILAVETSCDDTSFAIGSYEKGCFSLRANLVSSQTETHSPYGGVVPNLSAREHLKRFVPLLAAALADAKCKLAQIDAVAATAGPGLIPSLLVGTAIAKTISFYRNIPLVPIHHIEGHIYSNWLSVPAEEKLSKFIEFPVLALVVSGGHTQLIYMKGHLNYKIIGETLDDACGEAFDKVAKMLDLGYPGGPIIAKLAKKGNPSAFNFPRPMMNSGNLSFSFSGLKTAVLYAVKKEQRKQSEKKQLSENFINDVAASFQEAAIDILLDKTLKAITKKRPSSLLVAGGVSANMHLRQSFAAKLPQTVIVPQLKYTGDNAAMLLPAACLRLERHGAHGYAQSWKTVAAAADMPLPISKKLPTIAE